MPTTTTGVFFLTRQAPVAAGAGDAFTLTLHLLDRQAQHAVERYVVRWHGLDALAWWTDHATRIQPGAALHLVLHNPRSFPAGRSPETHATVHSCAIAPAPEGAARPCRSTTLRSRTA